VKLKQYSTIIGLGITAVGWHYAQDGIDYLSNKLNKFISSNEIIPNEIAKYTTSSYLIGVSLGSQLFIENCYPKNSVAVNYIEKTLIGYSYYLPAAVITGIAENLLKQYVSNNYSLNTITLSLGALAGSFVGNSFNINYSNSLHNSGGMIDNAAGIVLVTFSSIIGSAKSQEQDSTINDNVAKEENTTELLGNSADLVDFN
jgi:hypothetical protein